MLTIVLNGVAGVLLALIFGMAHVANWGWATFWGVLAFVAGQGLMGI